MAEEDTVPFEPDAVRDYLDGAIRQWRTTRERARAAGDDMDLPEHYIDAFQSVRTSLFGETLPIEPPS